jgi:molybdopterin molybdotransferase
LTAKPHVDIRDKGFKNLPSLTTVLDIIKNNVSKNDIEEVNLREQINYTFKILAEDVKAKNSVPNFTRATMDGFAVKSDDIITANETNKIELQVIEELHIKKLAEKKIEKKQAIKMPTGGVLPQGADTVIKLEDVEVNRSPSEFKIFISKFEEKGKNISEKGEDFKKGDIVFKKGRLLSEIDVGVLISIGHSYVKCYKNPEIAILSTGDEIVDEDRELLPGEVYDSNSYVLMQYLYKLGFIAKRYNIIQDNYNTIKNQLEKILENSDFVITTGGTSVGKKDFIPLIINELTKILVHGISIRPGSPTTLGIKNKKILLGLPGFPVSSLLSFAFFGIPIILTMTGSINVSFFTCKAILTEKFDSLKGRTDFLRVKLVENNESNFKEAIPIRVSGSSLLRTLSQSDGIVVLGDEIESIEAGSIVNVIITDKLINLQTN